MERSALEPLALTVCGLEFPKHYYEWESLLGSNKRLLVLCSRDHGKTTFFSILFPLYKIVRQSNFSICIISYSEAQAKDIIGGGSNPGIKDYIESKPAIKFLRPQNSTDSWSKTELYTSNKNTIVAQSFGNFQRGPHYDLVIIDDPVKDFGGMDADDQERLLRNAIIPTVKPGGQLLVVGSRVYDNDIIDRIEANKAFKTMVYPAISNGKALWPERWSLELLEERRKEVGDFAFSREYLLERIDPHTQFFKSNSIQYYDSIPSNLKNIITVDPAITTSGDDTGIIVTGTDENSKTYVLDYSKIKTDNITKIINVIFDMAQRWSVKLLVIESIGFQRLLKYWIFEEMRKRGFYFGVEEITHHQKSKEARIMALQPRIQSGSLLFHRSQKEIVDQLLIFPRGNHDDLIDSLCMGLNYWNSPAKIEPEAPVHSWEWWEKRMEKTPDNYRETLFSDFRPHNPPSDLTILQ